MITMDSFNYSTQIIKQKDRYDMPRTSLSTDKIFKLIKLIFSKELAYFSTDWDGQNIIKKKSSLLKPRKAMDMPVCVGHPIKSVNVDPRMRICVASNFIPRLVVEISCSAHCMWVMCEKDCGERVVSRICPWNGELVWRLRWRRGSQLCTGRGSWRTYTFLYLYYCWGLTRFLSFQVLKYLEKQVIANI